MALFINTDTLVRSGQLMHVIKNTLKLQNTGSAVTADLV
jgi:hypothetical protein